MSGNDNHGVFFQNGRQADPDTAHLRPGARSATPLRSVDEQSS
jgi:hypothetical protein